MSQFYSKTALGVQEMASRTLNLASGLRNALILIDKSRPLDKLMRDAQRIGAPADFIAQLLALKLIAEVENSQPIDTANKPQAATATALEPAASPNGADFDLKLAQRQLVKLVEKTLGPSGERIALAIESTKTKEAFLAIAAQTKTTLQSVRVSTADDPLWGSIGL